jgi:hypothetical protein
MGSDNLFHKRKARASKALQRPKNKRERNKRYLIVCEGTKTEPHYLRELLNDLPVRLQTVHIESGGVSPDRLVDLALKLYNQEEKNGDAYDAAYCVFDRDSHTTFNSAMQRIKGSKKPLIAITSTPCFEVWLLLHFSCSTQPFHAAGNKSVGDQVVSALKTKPGFDSYSKGKKNVYMQLKDKLSEALGNAEMLRKHCELTDSFNPATDMDKLILELKKLVV